MSLHTKFKSTISSNGKAARAVLLVAMRAAAIPDEATEQLLVFMTLSPHWINQKCVSCSTMAINKNKPPY
jgi:hypothetical protein